MDNINQDDHISFQVWYPYLKYKNHAISQSSVWCARFNVALETNNTHDRFFGQCLAFLIISAFDQNNG